MVFYLGWGMTMYSGRNCWVGKAKSKKSEAQNLKELGF